MTNENKYGTLAVTIGHCLLYFLVMLKYTFLPILDFFKQMLVYDAFPVWNLELCISIATLRPFSVCKARYQ